MSVDTQAITKLRELTGAGIGDCKSALEEAGGDIDKAVEVMRKKGAIKAAKKADRATKEGVIAFARKGDKVAVAGLACETDFVSRNEDYIKTVSGLAQKLLELDDVEKFRVWADEKIKSDLVVKIGENLQLVVADIVSGPVLGCYMHFNRKVAGIVVLDKGSEDVALDVAMHVVAMSPKCLKPDEVDPAELAKEKEIYRVQLKNEGKQEAMWDKIIEGKINKFYSDVCLLKQAFIKEDKKTIEKLLAENNGASILNYKRYQI